MKLRSYMFALVFLVVSCTSNNSPQNSTNNDGSVKNKVIYGDDNRLDIYQVTQSSLKDMAKSTVALISDYKMELGSDNNYRIKTSHYGQSYGLCKEEPFYNQLTAPHCSGSLVGPNLVLTAGHCVSSQSECLDTKFVFDYAMTSKLTVPGNAKYDNVYGCSKVIHTEVDNSTGSDFAVIRLDRNVAGRTPLSINRTGKIKVKEPLFVIGHPAGLPTKVAGGANVRSLDKKFFVANLDTYGGNSGSAVFNAKTGSIEGILVRGETDYKYKNGCNVSNVCSNGGCDGEEVTYVANALAHIPALATVPDREPAGGVNVYTSSPGIKIPDYDFSGTYDVIAVDQSTYGKEIFINLDITHTWRGDLIVVLVTPSGEQLVLHNRSGSYKNDLAGTYGINLNSVDSLESLNEESEGHWTLYLRDLANKDVGMLNSWSIEVK